MEFCPPEIQFPNGKLTWATLKGDDSKEGAIRRSWYTVCHKMAWGTESPGGVGQNLLPHPPYFMGFHNNDTL